MIWNVPSVDLLRVLLGEQKIWQESFSTVILFAAEPYSALREELDVEGTGAE